MVNALARRVATTLGAAAMVAATATMTASAADASVNGDYAANGVYIRACANTGCTAYGLGYPGQGATIYCFVSGQSINGWPYWDYNRDKATGVTGYSSDYYMSWVGTLYHC